MAFETTLYDLLEVSPHASAMVIKAAYRCLAQNTHPDKHQGSALAANERLARINHAYSVLSDPDQRQRYDRANALNRAAPERRGQASPGLTKNQRPSSAQAASRAFVFRPLA